MRSATASAGVVQFGNRFVDEVRIQQPRTEFEAGREVCRGSVGAGAKDRNLACVNLFHQLRALLHEIFVRRGFVVDLFGFRLVAKCFQLRLGTFEVLAERQDIEFLHFQLERVVVTSWPQSLQ